MPLEPLHLALDHLRQVDVVRVEDADELAAGELDPVVRVPVDPSGRRLADDATRSPYDATISGVASVEPSSITITSSSGYVCAENRVEALPDEGGAVEHRHDDRTVGFCATSPS